MAKKARYDIRKEPCQVCEGKVVTIDDPSYRNPRDAPAFTYCTQCATIYRCTDSKVVKYKAED